MLARTHAGKHGILATGRENQAIRLGLGRHSAIGIQAQGCIDINPFPGSLEADRRGI
ncbi:hypothetical protein ABT404_17820 [Streptomyces hyaluromycini]|uniref:Uncharacterized protein n=1 Tax=Streptomyces hyaluromycini TaxID=1377993 RepID=A0ABV1WX14_9ACTN